jgi:hypothetical protein
VATTAHCAIEGYRSAIETCLAVAKGNVKRNYQSRYFASIWILPFSTAFPSLNRDNSPRSLDEYQSSKGFTIKLQNTMDASFVPSEVVVKHYVSHKFTLELGDSITRLGKPIRNILIAVAVIYCVRDIVCGSVQAVLKRSRDTRPE